MMMYNNFTYLSYFYHCTQGIEKIIANGGGIAEVSMNMNFETADCNDSKIDNNF